MSDTFVATLMEVAANQTSFVVVIEDNFPIEWLRAKNAIAFTSTLRSEHFQSLILVCHFGLYLSVSTDSLYPTDVLERTIRVLTSQKWNLATHGAVGGETNRVRIC